MIHDPLKQSQRNGPQTGKWGSPNAPAFRSLSSITSGVSWAGGTLPGPRAVADRAGRQTDAGRRDSICLIHRPGAGTVGVWGLETRCAQGPLFLDARALPYLAPCCQEEVQEESQGGPSCTRAWVLLRRNGTPAPQSLPQMCPQSGCTGGHWGALQKSQKEPQWSSHPPSFNAGFPHAILLPNSVHLWCRNLADRVPGLHPRKMICIIGNSDC